MLFSLRVVHSISAPLIKRGVNIFFSQFFPRLYRLSLTELFCLGSNPRHESSELSWRGFDPRQKHFKEIRKVCSRKQMVCAVSSGICRQRRPSSACAFSQSDRGIHCPLTELLDTTECVNGNQKHGYDTLRVRRILWMRILLVFAPFRLARPPYSKKQPPPPPKKKKTKKNKDAPYSLFAYITLPAWFLVHE